MTRAIMLIAFFFLFSCGTKEETSQTKSPCSKQEDCQGTLKCARHNLQGDTSCFYPCQTNSDCQASDECIPLYNLQEPHERVCVGCYENNPKDCTLLGFFHGKQESYQKAQHYYDMACRNGDGDGCMFLGSLYEYGKIEPANGEDFLDLYKKGCEQKSALACASLGIYFEEKGNKEQENIYRDKACALLPTCGKHASCETLARLSCRSLPPQNTP